MERLFPVVRKTQSGPVVYMRYSHDEKLSSTGYYKQHGAARQHTTASNGRDAAGGGITNQYQTTAGGDVANGGPSEEFVGNEDDLVDNEDDLQIVWFLGWAFSKPEPVSHYARLAFLDTTEDQQYGYGAPRKSISSSFDAGRDGSTSTCTMLEGTSTAPSSSEQQQVVKELVREQQQTDQNQDEDLAPAPAPVFTTSTTPTPSSSSSSPSSSARPRPRRRLVVQTSSGGRELMSAKRRAVFAREVIDVVQDYAHTRAGVDLTTKKRKERLGGSSSASPTSSSSHIDGTEPEPPGGSPRTGGVAVASQTTPSSSSSGQKKGDSKRAVQPPRLALGNHIFFCFSNNGTFLLLTMRELNLVNPCAVVLDCAPGELTWRNIGRVFSHALPPRLASFFRPESSIVSPGSAKSIRESGISARGESALQDEQQHGDHDKKEELLETRSSTTKQPVVDTSNRKFLKQVARLCGPDCRMYFFYSKGDTLCEAWFIRECIRRRAAHVEQEGTTSRSNSSKGPIHLKHRTFEYVFGRSEHCANLLVYPREYKSLVAHVLAWESAADIADAEDQAEDLACPQPAMWAYNTNANNPEIGSGARTKEQRSRL